jgi:hypothetical protein
MPKVRHSTRLAFALLGWGLMLGIGPAGGGAPRGGLRAGEPAASEIDSELRLAVARGYRYLISRQSSSGRFDPTHPVAANALAGIAFLAGGVTEDVGPADQTRALRRGTDLLLALQTDSGYFDDGASAMYGHGFATLYLAELYGMTRRHRGDLRSALERAIRLIERAQSRNGGWDYTPRHEDAGGRDFSDTSITVCQTMALRAARNLGIAVDTEVVALARAYIASAQNEDGGFRYRQHFKRYLQEESALPRSAAGVCVLYSLGDYRAAQIQKGFDYLYKNYRSPLISFPYYGHYYCSQAMFQAGGKYWREYFPWVRESLLRKQNADGSWDPRASERENKVQCTAMALIILQLPYHFLPIHER